MSTSYFVPLSVTLVIAGILLPFWPLGALGVLLAALSGHPAVALICAAVLDLLWGVMPGFSQYYFFPAVLFALLGIVVRALSLRYVLEERSSHL